MISRLSQNCMLRVQRGFALGALMSAGAPHTVAHLGHPHPPLLQFYEVNHVYVLALPIRRGDYSGVKQAFTKVTNTNNRLSIGWTRICRIFSEKKSLRTSLGVVCFSILLQNTAQSAPPRAGTTIVNQATIVYIDENGTEQSTTTNEVILFVQQVFSAELTNDVSRISIPDAEPEFVHTLTNTGNGSDNYCISASQAETDSGDFADLEVYRDIDRDGVVSIGDPLLWDLASAPTPTQITLESGEVMQLIVRGYVPATAIPLEQYALDLLVSSTEGTAICNTGVVTDTGTNSDATDGTNRDIVTISDDAVLEISKASTYNAGDISTLSDDTIDYQVTIKNTGLTSADDIVIEDVLASTVSFQSFGTHDGDFSAGPTHLSGTISATALTLLPDEVLILRYSVAVDPTIGLNGESRLIENTAKVTADLDGDGNADPELTSNTTRDEAAPLYAVSLTDIGGVASAGVNDGADDDETVNDLQLVDVAAPGDTVYFRLDVTNQGNVTDTFNFIPQSSTGWLSSASLRYLNVDFATPLLDTNGDNIADTGILAPNETLSFVVAATMAYGVPAGPHDLTLEATSAGRATIIDDAGIRVLNSISPAVDLANTIGAVGLNDGGAVDADPRSSVTTTNSAQAGSVTTFDLFVANEGEGQDNYSLSAAADLSGTALPEGWTVSFASLSDEPIASTGLIQANSIFSFKAHVSVPAASDTNITQSIFFKVESALTNLSDIKQDAVTVEAKTPDASIYIGPDLATQISACGIRDNIHFIRNEGNTEEHIILAVDSQTLFQSDIRLPTQVIDNDAESYVSQSSLSVGDSVAVFSGSDWQLKLLVSDGAGGVAIPLAPQEQTKTLLHITAPCAAASGAVDILTLSATTSDGDAVSTLTDKTTVSDARVDLEKLGALDSNCDFVADANYSDLQVQAEPGHCVLWQISLKNASSQMVCDVNIKDTAPDFTSFSPTPPSLVQPSPGTGGCTISGIEIGCSVGNSADSDGDGNAEDFCLRSGETAQVTFAVQIN